MTTSHSTSEDFVKIHARTICYGVVDNKDWLDWKQDFELLELDQEPTKELVAPVMLVQFRSGITKKSAISWLRVIAEQIEEDGVPPTTRKIPRQDAVLVMMAQKLCAELSACLQNLPPALRAWWPSVLQDSGFTALDQHLGEAPAEFLEALVPERK
jgi:hypothetical protein